MSEGVGETKQGVNMMRPWGLTIDWIDQLFGVARDAALWLVNASAAHSGVPARQLSTRASDDPRRVFLLDLLCHQDNSCSLLPPTF